MNGHTRSHTHTRTQTHSYAQASRQEKIKQWASDYTTKTTLSQNTEEKLPFSFPLTLTLNLVLRRARKNQIQKNGNKMNNNTMKEIAQMKWERKKVVGKMFLSCHCSGDC